MYSVSFSHSEFFRCDQIVWGSGGGRPVSGGVVYRSIKNVRTKASNQNYGDVRFRRYELYLPKNPRYCMFVYVGDDSLVELSRHGNAKKKHNPYFMSKPTVKEDIHKQPGPSHSKVYQNLVSKTVKGPLSAVTAPRDSKQVPSDSQRQHNSFG